MINFTLVSAYPSNRVSNDGTPISATYSLISTQPISAIGVYDGEILTSYIEDLSDYEKIIQIQTSSNGSISLSAYDVFGVSASITTSEFCVVYGDKINLVDSIPATLRQWKDGKPSEFEQFISFFEDFLNTMYTQLDGSKLTILEKVKKLTQMHDPDLIDYEYLQFYANLIGYNIGITKDILSQINGEDENSDNVNKQIRQIVRELPNWYKIKSTRDSIRVMLYSFGIIGNMQQYYSNDYSAFTLNTSTAIGETSSDIINDNWPTPRFAIEINLLESIPSWVTQISNIIKLIDEIKPINVVLDRIRASLYVQSTDQSTVISTAASKYHQFIKIPRSAQVN